MKLLSATLLFGVSVLPFEVMSSCCTDRTDKWIIGNETRRWCVHAIKKDTSPVLPPSFPFQK